MTLPNQWYYVKKNERCGPVEATILKQLADVGDIKRTTLVWRVGMADWIEAEQVQGLFPKPVSPGTPSIVPDYQSALSQQPSPVQQATPTPKPPTQAATPQVVQPQPITTETASQLSFVSDETPPLDNLAQLIQLEPRIAAITKKVTVSAKSAKTSSAEGHPVGLFLDWLHGKVGRSFVDASVQLFAKIGFWAILAYAVILLIGSVIAAIQLQTALFLGSEIGTCILVLGLQYPAVKMLDLLGKWKFDAKVPRPFFDTIAVLAALAGVMILIGLTVRAVSLGSASDRIIFPYILWGIAAFVVFLHLATVAISFPEQEDHSEKDDPSITDMAYALFGGFLMITLRTVPVLFGVGITLCCLELLYSMISLRSPLESFIFTSTAGTTSAWMFGYVLLPTAAYLLSITLRFLGTLLVDQTRSR